MQLMMELLQGEATADRASMKVSWLNQGQQALQQTTHLRGCCQAGTSIGSNEPQEQPCKTATEIGLPFSEIWGNMMTTQNIRKY